MIFKIKHSNREQLKDRLISYLNDEEWRWENIKIFLSNFYVSMGAKNLACTVKALEFVTYDSLASKLFLTAFFGAPQYGSMHRAKWTCVQNPGCSEVAQCNTGEQALPETHSIHYRFDFWISLLPVNIQGICDELQCLLGAVGGGGVECGSCNGAWAGQFFDCWAVLIPSRERRAEVRISMPHQPACETAPTQCLS